MPAAAVIRRGQALFGFTGRKGCVGCLSKSNVKVHGSTMEVHSILLDLSSGEVSRILGVAVKCVDIEKNTCGESGSLVRN